MNRTILNMNHFDKKLKSGGALKIKVQDQEQLSNLSPATHREAPVFKKETINDPNKQFDNIVPIYKKGGEIMNTIHFGNKRKPKNIKLKLS